MLNVEPGKEEEFRYRQRWLAVSDRLDRLIEAAERGTAPPPDLQPAPVAGAARAAPRSLRAGPFNKLRAGPFDKLRAGFAARLARLALALHPEAAAGAVLRQGTESPR